MKAVCKVIPLIPLCWPITSEVNAGDMAGDAEPSRQYSSTAADSDSKLESKWQSM